MAEKQKSESDDDKTEEPSAQRLEDFRKEGQVAQSKELTSFFVLLATLVTIYTAGPGLISEFMVTVRKFFPLRLKIKNAWLSFVPDPMNFAPT